MNFTHVPPVTNMAKVLQKSKIFGAMGNTKKIIIGIKIQQRKCNTLIHYLIRNTNKCHPTKQGDKRK
jgi:hypothetical protein